MVVDKNMNVCEFFPRCYELKEEQDLKNFINEFKMNKVTTLNIIDAKKIGRKLFEIEF